MYAPSDGWYGYEKFSTAFSFTHKVRPIFVQYFGQTLTMAVDGDWQMLGSPSVPGSRAFFLAFPMLVFKPIEFPPNSSEHILGDSKTPT